MIICPCRFVPRNIPIYPFGRRQYRKSSGRDQCQKNFSFLLQINLRFLRRPTAKLVSISTGAYLSTIHEACLHSFGQLVLKSFEDYVHLGVYKRMVRFQKLVKNVILTLHVHSMYCQQMDLSKFLMRHTQFASDAYCGAAGPVSKMASQEQNAFCVLRFEVSRSVITVQREFRARFEVEAPAPQ
jgi:hypothetical protein